MLQHQQAVDESARVKSHSAKDASAVDKKIGAKINQLRVSMGITRQELAEKIGVTHQQLQKYEQGTNRVTASRLVDISNVLHVSVMYFFEDYIESLCIENVKKQRMCMEVMRNFMRIAREDQQDAIRQVIRMMAEGQ